MLNADGLIHANVTRLLLEYTLSIWSIRSSANKQHGKTKILHIQIFEFNFVYLFIILLSKFVRKLTRIHYNKLFISRLHLNDDYIVNEVVYLEQ